MTIPKNVTSVGSYCFYGCSLDSLVIEKSNTALYVAKYAFYECSLKNIYLGRNCNYTGLFAYDGRLTNIAIGDSVTFIGKDMFSECTSLQSLVIEDGEQVLEMESGAFNKSSLMSLYWGRNISGENPFKYKGNLKDVTIGNLVTEIRDSTFYGCSSITSMNVPRSVASIGSKAFTYCKKFLSLVIEDGEQVLEMGNDVFDESPLKSLYVGRNISRTNTFQAKTDLTDVTIGHLVTEILDSTFYRCIALSGIDIPNSVTSIGANAFAGCVSMTDSIIGNSVANIGEKAFYGCVKLENISFPNISSIGISAFEGCTELYSAMFSGPISGIKDRTFYGCSKLASIDLSSSISEIGEKAFYGCAKLANIDIPNATSIGGSAFEGCTELSGAIISDYITDVKERAFYGCKNLANILIPRAIKTVGKYAFAECSIANPAGITFAPGVTLEEGCFKGNKRLKRVCFEGTASIANNVFDDCDSLTFLGLLGNDMKDFTFNISPKKTHFKKILCMSTAVPNIPTFSSSMKSVYVPTEALSSYKTTAPWDTLTIMPLNNRRIYYDEKQLSAGDTIHLYCDNQNVKFFDNTDDYASLKWILEDAGDGLFYLKSATGNYMCDSTYTSWGFDYHALSFSAQQSDAVKVRIFWYAPEVGFVLQSVASGGYLTSKIRRGWSAPRRWECSPILETNSMEYYVFDITSAPLFASEMTISSSKETIEKKKTVRLKATISPSNAEYPIYKWTTSDRNVALVDADGLVYGFHTGTATITVTATSADGSILKDSCRVTVVNATDSIADSEKVWTEVTSSNIESLKDGAIIKIYFGGQAGNEEEALSATLNESKLYPVKYLSDVSSAGEGGEEWTLVKAGEGSFYLINDLGLCWFNRHSYGCTTFDLTEANKMELVWNPTGQGFLFKNLDDNTYLYGPNSIHTKWYGKEAACTYNVYVATKGVLTDSMTFNINSEVLYRGDTLQLKAIFVPADASQKQIIWTSNNDDIATVSSDGLVTAHGIGYTQIIGRTTNGSNLTYTCNICVVKNRGKQWAAVRNSTFKNLGSGSVIQFYPYGTTEDEGMAISSNGNTFGTKYNMLLASKYVGEAGNEWTLIDAGDSCFYLRNGLGLYWTIIYDSGGGSYVQTTLLPSEAQKVKLIWNSEYPGIIFKLSDEIYSNAYLRYSTFNSDSLESCGRGSTYLFSVYVSTNTVLAKSVELDREEATLSPWESLQLTATVLPEDANNKSISWSSSDESVAKVSRNGQVTAVHTGTATITASTTDGSNLSATCVITVVNFGGDEWTEVTNSNIGSLTGGSVVKICPYGYAGYENATLSSSTSGATYYDNVLTATVYAGQEGGNKWTLIGAGDGTFYLRNGVGLYWAFQQSDTENYYMVTVSDQSGAVKVSLVWNDTYSGVAFKNAQDGTYLCNLGGYNFAYNWYNGDQPLTADTNYTYNVYVSSNKESGIDGVSVDGDTDVVYYQFNGVKLAGKPQQEGVYIRVKDGKSQKIVVRKK